MPDRIHSRLLWFLLTLCWVGGVVSADSVFLTQNSEPPELVAEETAYMAGTIVSTIQAPRSISGYHFTHWRVNGVVKRDPAGRSIDPVVFTILENVTATAVYCPESQDSNTNNVPDWWEYEFVSQLGPSDGDTDADGFNLREQYARDYHPGMVDEVRPGCVAVSLSAEMTVLGNTNLVRLVTFSDPPELVPLSLTVTNSGAEIRLPDQQGEISGRHFTHWTIDGLEQRDVTGRALSAPVFEILNDTTAVAHYTPTSLDSDGNGVPDWYELQMSGSLGSSNADGDGDGFSLREEYARDYHPGMADDVRPGCVAVNLSAAMTVLGDTNLVRLVTFSDPPELIPQTLAVTNAGAEVRMPDQQGEISGRHFTHWTLNGVEQRDGTGRALTSPVFEITNDTISVAHYTSTSLDSDANGVPDWYELQMSGSLGNSGSDGDGDGFSLREEYARDYHPGMVDEVRPGCVAVHLSSAMTVLGDTNLVRLVTFSDPPELVPLILTVMNAGEAVQLSDQQGEISGRHFMYWTLDGVEQRDGTGRALAAPAFEITHDTTAVAHYSSTSLDSDGNNVSDWYELQMSGSLGSSNADADGDGFSLREEYARDYHPGVVDEVRPGCVAIYLAESTLLNFQYFIRIKETLVDGSMSEFFSNDTSVTGTFSTVANSHPALGDWDGDGDLDLFVGGSNGVMRIFENAGSPTVINWVERTIEFAALAGCWTNVLNPAPTLGDWNHDGLADLAVGGGTGTVWLATSPGNWESANLTVELQTSFDTGAGSAVPAFADVNADGWTDLLVLTEAGTVWCFVHTQSISVPYATPPCTTDLLGTPVPNACGIATADVNGDGVTDILISDDNGNIWEFHGNGL